MSCRSKSEDLGQVNPSPPWFSVSLYIKYGEELDGLGVPSNANAIRIYGSWRHLFNIIKISLYKGFPSDFL